MRLEQRLKMLRTDADMSQKTLANMMSVAESTIGMYEQGRRTPNTEILEKYTEIFDVTYDYLLGKTNTKNYSPDCKTINVYGRVPAGIPVKAMEDIIDTEDISFKYGYSPNKDYIGLVVDGDSMYPKYLKDDIIIIEIAPDCESGTDCVVYVNGYDATLKTLIKNDDGTITLRPINQAYPPRTYGPDDEPIKVLGIVREIRRKV